MSFSTDGLVRAAGRRHARLLGSLADGFRDFDKNQRWCGKTTVAGFDC